MKISFTGLSDPGLIRSSNQDSYYAEPEGRFFLVADGMGGHAGGEQASRIATEEIQQYLLKNWDSSKSGEELLQEACFQANEAIINDQKNHPERAECGEKQTCRHHRSRMLTKCEAGDDCRHQRRGCENRRKADRVADLQRFEHQDEVGAEQPTEEEKARRSFDPDPRDLATDEQDGRDGPKRDAEACDRQCRRIHKRRRHLSKRERSADARGEQQHGGMTPKALPHIRSAARVHPLFRRHR